VQVVHGGQHVRAGGALLAACLDQTPVLEALQHGIQQQGLGPAGDQASAELREPAEVKAGVGQLEAEGVLPVDAGAHGVGGLPVTEGLEDWNTVTSASRHGVKPGWPRAG
jgi:hypothetical protein